MLAPLFASCLHIAAIRSHLPPAIIMSVLDVEAGRVGSKSHNENGTDDFGPGQINSVWVPEIAKTIGQPTDIAQQLLQWDGCFNIRVTAAILRYQINAAGGNFWQGVAFYHSHAPVEGAIYVQKVVAAARSRFGARVFADR